MNDLNSSWNADALKREMVDRLSAESRVTCAAIDRAVAERREEREAAAERRPPVGQETAS